MKKISVIVPVYNVEKYLERCIFSIIRQKNIEFEIILVDDGSNDNSGSICDTYEKMYKNIFVFHQENKGLSYARNLGLTKAKGEYVTFIDSDDYVADDYLDYLYTLAIKNNADIIATPIYPFCGDRINQNSINDVELIKKYNNSELALEELLYGSIVGLSACGKLYKKDCFRNITFIEGYDYEEILTIPRLFKNDKVTIISNRKIYYYYQRQGSIMNNKISSYKIKSVEKVREYMIEISNENPTLDVAAKTRYINILLATIPSTLSNNNENIAYFKHIQKEVNKIAEKTILFNKRIKFTFKIRIIALKFNYRIAIVFFKFYQKIKNRMIKQ